MKSHFSMKKLIAGLLLSVIAFASFSSFGQTGVIQSVLNVSNKVNTYSAVADRFAIAASPTDVFTISGSASRTVYIKAITLSGIATTSATVPFRLAKRSTAGTYLASAGVVPGVDNAVTNVPLLSSNTAATAALRYFTGNMTTVGTLIGYIDSRYLNMPAGLNTANTSIIRYEFGNQLSQYPTLTSAAETIAINMTGTTVTGGTLAVTVEWMER